MIDVRFVNSLSGKVVIGEVGSLSACPCPWLYDLRGRHRDIRHRLGVLSRQSLKPREQGVEQESDIRIVVVS